MVMFCEPEQPEIYWVNCITCECKKCGEIFDVLIPNGDEIVDFIEENSEKNDSNLTAMNYRMYRR